MKLMAVFNGQLRASERQYVSYRCIPYSSGQKGVNFQTVSNEIFYFVGSVFVVKMNLITAFNIDGIYLLKPEILISTKKKKKKQFLNK